MYFLRGCDRGWSSAISSGSASTLRFRAEDDFDGAALVLDFSPSVCLRVACFPLGLVLDALDSTAGLAKEVDLRLPGGLPRRFLTSVSPDRAGAYFCINISKTAHEC